MAPSAEETAAVVEQLKSQLATAEAEHSAAIKDAPPRDPPVVLAELLGLIVMRFGHHPELTRLLNEFIAGSAPKTE